MTAIIQTTIGRTDADWDGDVFFRAWTAALDSLTKDEQRLNDLNVFPVPDGDTGTNMAATLRAGLAEASLHANHKGKRADAVVFAIGHGALMKANGNSGLILSQVLLGFSRAFAGRSAIDGGDFARALRIATDLAYRAVIEPVEGTILTVLRAASAAAAEVPGDASIEAVITAALADAEKALANTTAQLPLLRQAGVVDAGGLGFVDLLQALLRFAQGTTGAPVHPDYQRSEAIVRSMHGKDEYGYCTNFMVIGTDLPFERARAKLARHGTSAVIAGDDSAIKVHIHTDHPGTVLECAKGYGELIEISIENMSHQISSLHAIPVPPSSTTVALIAIVEGDGIQAVFSSLGATVVVAPDSASSSTTSWLQSILEESNCDRIILLPNSEEMLAASMKIAGLTSKELLLVESRTIPQGLAALAIYKDCLEPRVNVQAMNAALTVVRTVAIRQRESGPRTSGDRAEGGYIAIVDGNESNASEDELDVVAEGLELAGASAAELITVFAGTGVPPDSSCLERIRAMFPDAEVDILNGGQCEPRYIISIE